MPPTISVRLDAGALRDRLAAVAASQPDAAALIAPDRRAMSYAMLIQSLDRIVNQLRDMGIEPGDRIAIVLPNGPEMAMTFLAVASFATAAPLNPAYRESDFEFYLDDLDARAVITMPEISASLAPVAAARNIPVITLSVTSHHDAGDFDLQPAASRSDRRSDHDPNVAMILHTSGTTSRPKIVPLSQSNLLASADHIRRTLHLTPDDVCLNITPLFHIHGLIAALLASLAAGSSIICSPGFIVTQFFDWLKKFRPTWYTAVPTMHQSILARISQNPREIDGHRLRFIRSSSAALSPNVAQSLELAFHVPVIEAYGMTEASHQMCCNPLPPAVRKFGSVGPAAGPDVAIMNADGQLLSCGVTGEVVIRGANVTAGYENNSDANAVAFSDGWFRTGDQGYLDDEGYLHLTGRLKELILRGGENIAPREIDEVLLQHPAVKQAVAFAMPDERLGEDVAAAVVLHEGATADEQTLRRFAAEKLTDFKVPRRIVILDAIPTGPTGKLQRIGLAEKLGLKSQRKRERTMQIVPPRNKTESLIAGIWREVLRTDDLCVNDEFFTVGGDSVLGAQVIARITRITGAELPILVLFESPTIAGMAQRLDEVFDTSES